MSSASRESVIGSVDLVMAASSLLAGGVLALAVVVTRAALQAHRAATIPAPAPGAGVAPLSVIVAAHDEASRIGGLIESLLAQDHPDFEVVVVDDRSTDATRAAARDAAQDDTRVRVLRVDDRPPGWQGRLFAQGVGVAASSREWLLFLSADQRLVGADFLRSLLAAYAARGLAAASVLGPFPGRRWWQTWWFRPIADNPVLLGCIFLVQRLRGEASWLIGALALRRETYEQVGGAAAASAFGAAVFDDWGWTRVFERRGLRTAMLFHPGLHDVSNWESFRDGWNGLSRWSAGILTCRPGARLAAAVLVGLVVTCFVASVAVVAALAAGRMPGIPSLALAAVPPSVGLAYCRAHGYRRVLALLASPLSLLLLAPLFGGVFARWRNRIRWRDEEIAVVASVPALAPPAAASPSQDARAPEAQR